MSSVVNWSPQEVSIWLEKKGHGKYCQLLTEDHYIDGRALLLINEADLKCPPISINVCLFCLIYTTLCIYMHIGLTSVLCIVKDCIKC